MPVSDHVAVTERIKSDPQFTTVKDMLLAFECLNTCMLHMIEHGHVARCVWLSDLQYEEYLALYPIAPEAGPTFFGIPVKANKSV
jgi:hypothetical protein